jgi:hypothetical protein
VRVFVHQPAARLGKNPLGAEQERRAAMVADAEADQMRRQFLKIAIRQIRDDPRESFERRQPADVAESDVGNQRILVTAMIERRDLESGAAQFKRQMAATSGRLQHPALNRDRPQQRWHNPRCVESQIAVALDALKTGRRDVGVPLRGLPCLRLVGRNGCEEGLEGGRCHTHPPDSRFARSTR